MLVQRTTTLPVEIWAACLGLCTLQQLRRVSLVCRLFRSLVLPRFFQEQTLSVVALGWGLDKDNWMDRVRHLHRTAVRLDRLAESPFRSFVHTWTVSFGLMALRSFHPEIENIHLFDTLNARVLQTFVITLENYRNLSSLHIDLATIDDPFRRALESLPKLKELRLRNCHIDAAEGFLTIETLEMNHCSANEPVRLVSRNNLSTLNIRGADISLFIAGFGPDALINLVDLSVHGIRDVEVLVRFLRQCPHLQSLALESPTGPLPSTTIPLLRNLTGPPAVVQLLTPGRPVSNIVISGPPSRDSLMLLCTDISQATVPLRSLTWPFPARENEYLEALESFESSTPSPMLQFFAAIPALFPELAELSFKFPAPIDFRCGNAHMYFPESTMDTPVDRRTLELNDNEAFLYRSPGDEISDAEAAYVSPTPVVVQERISPKKLIPAQERSVPESFVCTLQAVLDLFIDDLLSLPHNIEIFRAEEVDYELPLTFQHKVLAALTPLYAHLREVQLDARGTSWTRTGNVWARDAAGHQEVVKIVPNEKSVEEFEMGMKEISSPRFSFKPLMK
ncbi:hypothetical protein B0H11DRAFT_1974204 [Mycena galericulata]|nr:hypothetical protein B0H11DRAFT_1974204 [Mycena galericulata]